MSAPNLISVLPLGISRENMDLRVYMLLGPGNHCDEGWDSKICEDAVSECNVIVKTNESLKRI